MFPYGSSRAWKRKGNNELYYAALGVISAVLLIQFQSALSAGDKLLLVTTLTLGILKTIYYSFLKKKAYIQFYKDRLEIAQFPLFQSKQLKYNQIHHLVRGNDDTLTLNMVDGSEFIIDRNQVTEETFRKLKDILVESN
ncbi:MULTISPECIES: hypothetical protein [Pontibacillus]|uniref:Uncharacterized protein n=1 Tax=Pontibacillus chungwhensis TaxID=265426 RepID=A0ABY8UTW9_9BACI|nr:MULTISPECIES: hypothetical protein [Pontibacillus]MCD5323260.1 hypothetical protein [Pontibacillus sp. HN14]WIF96643.1 hypothetical protein QNI29_12885 [Pontibacillus chungwhensis]